MLARLIRRFELGLRDAACVGWEISDWSLAERIAGMRTASGYALIYSELVLCALINPWFVTAAKADFIININYTGDAQFESFFTSAKTIWESKFTGYQNGVATTLLGATSYTLGQTVDRLFIDASVVPIDGVNGVLGSAGPTAAIRDQLGFAIATNGNMQFDSADIAALAARGSLESVILHEMAHVMGFGTLWELNNLYSFNSGEFLGANATQAWQKDYRQTGTPDVELEGGAGTANGHWNENAFGAGLTGITDTQGRDMRDEIMTGWLNPNAYISEMTVQSFVDIGFRVSAVPEPGTLSLIGWAIAVACVHRRRPPKL